MIKTPTEEQFIKEWGLSLYSLKTIEAVLMVVQYLTKTKIPFWIKTFTEFGRRPYPEWLTYCMSYFIQLDVKGFVWGSRKPLRIGRTWTHSFPICRPRSWPLSYHSLWSGGAEQTLLYQAICTENTHSAKQIVAAQHVQFILHHLHPNFETVS